MKKEYTLKLSEFEILTLREGLYKMEFCRDILSEEELKKIDNKIIGVLKE